MENFSVFNSTQSTTATQNTGTETVHLFASEPMTHSNSNNDTNQTHQDILTIFKLTESSLQLWKSKYENKAISYKLCIIDFKRKDSDARSQEEVSSNICEYVCRKSQVEIAVLNENDCKFKNQDQFGHVFNSEDYVFLKAVIDDMNKWAYMFDFYVKNGDSSGAAEHIGYAYLLPLNLQQDNGTINTVITGNNHKPIGQFVLDYLIVKPLKNYSNTLVHKNNWNDVAEPMHIGHRGSGKWRRSDKIENVLENTIASFNYAAKHGADMVELDVHLSKDRVPVIYHDFNIQISIKKKASSDAIKAIYGVKDLMLSELQMLKLNPVDNANHDFSESDPTENQPFPTLEQVLESIPVSCGFNVEIKYPMYKEDGSLEGPRDHEISENDFVDIILTTLFEHAKERRIVLSTFHPDICTLLNLKQNRFPVLFLTQGLTKRYMAFRDPRANSIKMAIYLAKVFNFWGINVHAEELFRNMELVKHIKSLGLKLFSWGEDINSNDAVNLLRKEGVDGIIYDKIDVYNTKFVAIKEEMEIVKTGLVESNVIQQPILNEMV